MTRLMITLAATAAAAAGTALLPVPGGGAAELGRRDHRLRHRSVPAFDRRPGRGLRAAPENERYRIPEKYRPSGTRQQQEAWANKAKVIETVGATGINSCSPVGPGGYTGCLTRVIKEAREQRKQQAEDTTPPE